MQIYCSKGKNTTKPLPVEAGQLVNRVGKYFYEHLDGAYKFEKKPNMYDVYFHIVYQIPPEILKKYHITDQKYAEAQIMEINYNITTYQNKIRVDTIVCDPDERTLGFDLFKPELIASMPIEAAVKDVIYPKVCRRVEKEFSDYVFYF